ncbi:MAG: aminotransferase class I/II-fold pyridoxal phosphate-dependent enzyme [Planctomycetes bacterium]|nr:aminotransferase class I/II-fold pyridoxal phosphate-dependent enzyme [Planctomycetota bacterium]
MRGDLISVLRDHAALNPNGTAFSFLTKGRDEQRLTYSALDRRARSIAVRLQALGLAGRTVMLAYPHGLDFISGLFGCWYAGSVAAPSSMPHRRTLANFERIVIDADAGLILSTADGVSFHSSRMRESGRVTDDAEPVPWLATDNVAEEACEAWAASDIDPGAPAMVQYTSGSTGRPKGVVITHSNLMHNTRAILRAFGMENRHDSGVFWLPTYHDMGLVGGVLVPLMAGAACSLMSPTAFARSPIDWLSAISDRHATISGGPDFAYDLCARTVTPAQKSTLDLSGWRLAFIGAEAIRPETLDRFAAAFAPCGFHPRAFYPCYGMAEATLMVSGGEPGAGALVQGFDARSLNDGVAAPTSAAGPECRRLVCCGKPIGGMRAVVVDPLSLTAAKPGRVGEIWVSGASVAKGYWRQADTTIETFAVHLADTGEGPFLRTKDLGFATDDGLFVTGRMDDLIIVRGRNHYPQDLEATARSSHPLMEIGPGAAFILNDSDETRVVLVQEVACKPRMDFSAALSACREAVLAEHGLLLDTISLVRGGTIPRTSSGKVRRHFCRAAFASGQLKELARDFRGERTEHGSSLTSAARSVSRRQPVASIPETSVLAAVYQHATTLGGAALSEASPETPLTALGLDSLHRVELAAALERTFACRLPDKEFNPERTLGDLAHAVQRHLNDHRIRPRIAMEFSDAACDFAQFPEFRELERYERMLRAVTGSNPYFRVDQGGSTTGGVTREAGRDTVNFGVYDYIGMGRAPAVAAAAKAAIDQYGTSAGASRLVSGEKQVHRDLEHALAEFLGVAAAIVFVSGHATNVTTIGHLMGPEDLIVYDAFAHNSIIQGAQLSGATRRAFAHNDWRSLDGLLSEVRGRHRRVLIAVEGVYSMDGDFPDLPRFIELKRKHKAMMLVDEAHSLGTMGPTGRGIGEHWGVARADVDLWMGTLSKSLASCGGYIGGSAEIVKYLAYTAPGFVYSVGLAPSNAAAALAALTLLAAEPGRVTRLRELAALFRAHARSRGLNTGTSAGTPVVPVIVGNSVKALRLASGLLGRGINAPPILPPAVPEQSSRLRFFVTTEHSEAQIRNTVDAVADELARL